MIKKLILTSILAVLPLVSNAAMPFTGFYQTIDVSTWKPVVLNKNRPGWGVFLEI